MFRRVALAPINVMLMQGFYNALTIGLRALIRCLAHVYTLKKRKKKKGADPEAAGNWTFVLGRWTNEWMMELKTTSWSPPQLQQSQPGFPVERLCVSVCVCVCVCYTCWPFGLLDLVSWWNMQENSIDIFFDKKETESRDRRKMFFCAGAMDLTDGDDDDWHSDVFYPLSVAAISQHCDRDKIAKLKSLMFVVKWRSWWCWSC